MTQSGETLGMFGTLANLATFLSIAVGIGLLGSYLAGKLPLLYRASRPWKKRSIKSAASRSVVLGLAFAIAWVGLGMGLIYWAHSGLCQTAAGGQSFLTFLKGVVWLAPTEATNCAGVWPRVWRWGLIIPGLFFPFFVIMGQSLAVASSIRRMGVLTATAAALESAPRRLPKRPHATVGRRIVICCDGTRNSPDAVELGRSVITNIAKISRALVDSEAQTVWYDAGVGSGTSTEAVRIRTLADRVRALIPAVPARLAAFGQQARNALEATTGTGITENIVEAYTEIVRQYRPGDRIFLFGFSRGAYTARCVAGVIARCGLLKAENIRYAEEVVRLYRTRSNADNDVPIDGALIHDRGTVAIEMLGVFDTVASLGAPLWGWWFRVGIPNAGLTTNPAPICRHVYHALAMDERRSSFFPTLFDEPKSGSWTETLEQVWFRGAHADIGGGYAETGLSDITLNWMVERGRRHGLVFDSNFPASAGDPMARIHDELRRQPFWRLLGSWPRWHPVDNAAASCRFGVLHSSVLLRATIVQALLGRHDLRRLSPGDGAVEIVTEAHREWDRTGIVIDGGGARYELSWEGQSQWRDKDAGACGPGGQMAGSGDIRRRLNWRKRLPKANWMVLCASIAHPREWPLREGRFREYLGYLCIRDPEQLRNQVAPIGEDLADGTGDRVTLCNMAEAGLLYLFANDWWQTAPNNSGALTLRVRRLADSESSAGTVWALDRQHGTWMPPSRSRAT